LNSQKFDNALRELIEARLEEGVDINNLVNLTILDDKTLTLDDDDLLRIIQTLSESRGESVIVVNSRNLEKQLTKLTNKNLTILNTGEAFKGEKADASYRLDLFDLNHVLLAKGLIQEASVVQLFSPAGLALDESRLLDSPLKGAILSYFNEVLNVVSGLTLKIGDRLKAIEILKQQA